MKRCCPNKSCSSPHFLRDGTFFRSSDSKSIQRFRCRSCGKKFSAATFESAYRQKKRRINSPLNKLLCSGVSQRRAAIILSVSRKTIERHFLFLADNARKQFNLYWQQQPQLLHDIQFDDLQTIEHTKLKPLSVSIAISAKERKIVALQVSQMPATGHLAAVSRKKYGKRKDRRKQGLRKLFKTLQERVAPDASFMSDQHPFYAPEVARAFPRAHYRQVKGGRGSVAGQGELKKLRYDPLFSLNHSFAMLRANINRLFRKTWCTTKKPERLEAHLYLYADFHNRVLTA